MKTFSDSVLENLKSVLVEINKEGEIQFVSSSVKNVLGYSPEQLIGRNWQDSSVCTDTELKFFNKGLRKILRKNSVLNEISYEQQLKNIFGKDKWILWSAKVENNDSIIAIGQDITEFKKNLLLLKQKNNELDFRQSETIKSIEYASRLQSSIFPSIESFKPYFKDAFIFNRPKDIIGGDYFFLHKIDNKVIIAMVDCTGHGVPGALLTVVANAIFKEIIVNKRKTNPSEILYLLDNELNETINSRSDIATNYDGMDVAIGVFDTDNRTLTFSGAFRPVIIIRENELIELKPNKFPIGFYGDVEKTFTNREIDLNEGDSLYFFTDGFVDQFGGERNKKFTNKRFKELLLFTQSLEFEEQESFFAYALNNWKQNEPQIDDITILGIKI